MTPLIRNAARAAAVASFALTFCASAMAQAAFPARPVKVINPLPPGGIMDGMLRRIGAAYQEKTGQPLVVESKSGANTIIAAESCAKSPPDGYTICMLSSSTTSLNPHLYKKLPYSVPSSFEPITQIAVATQVLVANKNLQASNLADVVKYAKANPDKLNYASFGIGNDGHLALEWFTKTTGASMKHIPYRGAAPAMLGFRTDEVQIMFLILGNPGIVDQIKAGDIKALAVTGNKRSPIVPDVPTFAEAGYPYQGQSWFGFFAPAGTPKAVVDKLHADLAGVINSPDLRKSFFEPSGFDPVGNSPAEFTKFIAADSKIGAELVKMSGVSLD
jgi:tripartite-type tricarboxylate transporter receptor subunit TctC